MGGDCCLDLYFFFRLATSVDLSHGSRHNNNTGIFFSLGAGECVFSRAASSSKRGDVRTGIIAR